MSKHTPGPWKFTEGEYFYVNSRVDGKRVFILQRKKSVVAAATAYQEAEEDRIRADCHLIAASPDLLAALKALVQQVERGDFDHIGADHPDSAVGAARAAIAKAEVTA